ncbi:hypothetical protein F2P56_015261 [Juglans regia]|uniref:DUF4283 domain-containing protein n=2 Tax=Juglans regia TaxID=51240 RepID=A0A833XER0_JUGRE|nr:uncharacterized protein LOC108987319 [Juglans regia]KAF5465236.1 hypothetical protein F2P56_015261 [Juglans regia]
MEDEDSPWVPIWLTLPGLPPNYFQESMLRSIGNGFGCFLKQDNAMTCVTHPEAVHICVEIGVSQPLRNSFWLGPPGLATSHFQEVVIVSIPSFCVFGRKQGHLEDGVVFDACMEDCRAESSTVLCAGTDVVHVGVGPSDVLSMGVDTHVKETPSNKEEMDEALEFELGGLGDRDFFKGEDLNNVGIGYKTGSEGESEDDLNELAAKSFDSDPDMHVPLKKVKGQMGKMDEVAILYNNAEVGGKIWLFWAEELKFELISMSDQALSGWFIHGMCRVLATFVYASGFRVKWLDLRDFLKGKNSCGLPWFIVGDSNIIRNDSEKVGGLLQASRAKREFNDCIHECTLVDLPCEGNRLSWCNGRLGGRQIWPRMDGALVNLHFLSCFGNVSVSYLPRTSYDHAPMLVKLVREVVLVARPFRFLRMWGSHEEFIPLVQLVWNSNIEGCAMF